ncbi:MAG: endolytic transglycosylase MltG [Candidatus Eisenbacteria bacterium]
MAFYRDSLEAQATLRGLTRRQLWTLASIVEAEAARAEERPLISAVFWNRLKLGMRLESDPTVLYALGRAPGRVTFADLAVDSPYNTYRNAGLPPGPICCPGRDALRAAARPNAGVDALFFVARGDGTHVFSRTFAQHGDAIRAVRATQAGCRADIGTATHVLVHARVASGKGAEGMADWSRAARWFLGWVALILCAGSLAGSAAAKNEGACSSFTRIFPYRPTRPPTRSAGRRRSRDSRR